MLQKTGTIVVNFLTTDFVISHNLASPNNDFLLISPLVFGLFFITLEIVTSRVM